LGDEIAGVLQEKTEGWIAGLRLAALALDELANHEGREAMIHPASTVLGLDYLAQEVFDRQSPAVREFLLRISVLDRFCVPLCTAVTGYPVEKSKEIVDWVASANLFLVPLDAGGAWYRYHHLFRDLLRLHLEERYDKVEIADLYARASQWFERNGSVEDAIYYALSAGSPEAAARIVKRHRHAAMNQEQWHRLRRWMDQLPDYVVEESVELLLTRAWLLNSEFKTGKLPGLLDRVEAMLDRSDSSYGPEERAVLRGEASALRSALDHWFGQGQLCLEHAQYAIEVTPPEHEWVRGMALDRLPLGFQLVGQLGKAYEAAYALLAQGGQIGSRYIIRGYISLAVIEAAAANLRALQRSATQMLALATEAGLPETRGWALQILGAVHYFWNDLAEAERCFTEVSEMRYQAHPRTVTNSLLGLALTHQALGRSDAATQVSDAAIAWAREVGSVGLMLEAHSLASRLQLMQGRVPDTRRWRSLLDSYGPSGIFGLEIPRLTLAEVLTATGTSEALHEAGELLASMTAFAEKTHWTSGLMRIRALQALRSDALREAETATTLLGEAVEIAAPGRCIRVFVDVGAPMAGLLARLRSRWTTDQSPTRKFVDQLLAAFGPEGQQALARSRRLPPTVEPLTEREREVLVLLGRNLTNREIAEELVISSATVKTHTLNIYRKLGVRGRQQAVARASALGIL
jgi:LuxR family maltose regulon positive regulatory protein